MWQEDDIALIGRDRLLEKELLPRARGTKPPCLLLGISGVGVSACLEWMFEQAPRPKALVSAHWPPTEICRGIARGWGLEIENNGKKVSIASANLGLLNHAINRAPVGRIFVDDIDAAKPAILRYLKPWREKFLIFCGGTPPLRSEELKRILWRRTSRAA